MSSGRWRGLVVVVGRTRPGQSRLDSARKWNSRRVSPAHSALDAKWGPCRCWPGDPRQCHMHWSRPLLVGLMGHVHPL